MSTDPPLGEAFTHRHMLQILIRLTCPRCRRSHRPRHFTGFFFFSSIFLFVHMRINRSDQSDGCIWQQAQWSWTTCVPQAHGCLLLPDMIPPPQMWSSDRPADILKYERTRRLWNQPGNFPVSVFLLTAHRLFTSTLFFNSVFLR